jgi:hypothetical protein
MNLDLDKTDAEAHFAEEPTHNIWDNPQQEDEDESDTPAFLRRRKKHNHTDEES